LADDHLSGLDTVDLIVRSPGVRPERDTRVIEAADVPLHGEHNLPSGRLP
jgi:hypothetical protein